MSKTRALIKRQLDSNTDYEVIVTLDDDGEENKQVRRFTIKTPVFYSSLRDYISETKVSKQISTDEHTSTKIVYPKYTVTTTDTWTIKSIDVKSMGKPNIGSTGYDPTNKSKKESKFEIELKFSHPTKKLPKLSDITLIENVGDPFTNLFLNKDGWKIDEDKKTVTISKFWCEVDTELDNKSDWTKKADGYGFWGSKIWVGLNSLNKATNFKTNPYWTALSSAYIQVTNSHDVSKPPVGGETTRQHTLSSTIDTNIPAFIVGNSMNDYSKAKVVDYFYFFVNQQGSDKWWYFDENLNSITPAKINLSSDSKSEIIGSKGYITIDKNNNINGNSFPPVKKVVTKVTDKTKEISKAQLKSRPISANANVYSGISKKYNIDSPPKSKFPIISFNIRFGIVRYISTDNGVTWTGKWMPSLNNTDKNKEALKILSRPEIVGVT